MKTNLKIIGGIILFSLLGGITYAQQYSNYVMQNPSLAPGQQVFQDTLGNYLTMNNGQMTPLIGQQPGSNADPSCANYDPYQKSYPLNNTNMAIQNGLGVGH